MCSTWKKRSSWEHVHQLAIHLTVKLFGSQGHVECVHQHLGRFKWLSTHNFSLERPLKCEPIPVQNILSHFRIEIFCIYSNKINRRNETKRTGKISSMYDHTG